MFFYFFSLFSVRKELTPILEVHRCSETQELKKHIKDEYYETCEIKHKIN